LNILDALQLIKSTVQSFEFIRNDSEQMTSMIESALSFAQKIEIDVEGDLKKHHRTRRTPQRFDANAQNASTLDLKTFYQKEFNSVLDRYILDTKENFTKILEFFRPFKDIFQIPAS